MTAEQRKEIVAYAREYIENGLQQNEIINLTVLQSRIKKNFAQKFELDEEKFPSMGAVSKYVHSAGYEYDKKTAKFVPLSYFNIDTNKMVVVDQPHITIIKLHSEDAINIRPYLENTFAKDIIFIDEKTNDKQTCLIVYSTKWELGKSLLEEIDNNSVEIE